MFDVDYPTLDANSAQEGGNQLNIARKAIILCGFGQGASFFVWHGSDRQNPWGDPVCSRPFNDAAIYFFEDKNICFVTFVGLPLLSFVTPRSWVIFDVIVLSDDIKYCFNIIAVYSVMLRL